MTLGAYILMQNPLTNKYPYSEVVNCCLDIFDEILIVDGGTDDGSFDLLPKTDRIKFVKRLWPSDASWDFLTQQYDFGLQNLTTDWRFKIDADYLFHENDYQEIKDFLQKNEDKKIISFEKSCFNLIDRYRSKTKIGLAVNKKHFPNIHWNTDDKYQDGDEVLEEEDWTTSGIKVYVYDNCFKTKEMIGKTIHKFALAVKDKYGMNWGYESEQAALDFMIKNVRTRIDAYQQSPIKLEAHPKYIQERIKNMTENQMGYSLFSYKKASYFEKNIH